MLYVYGRGVFALLVAMPERGSPTMKDVAEAAGVARSTVSMALRNDPSIPAATRARIIEVANRIGYRPNPLVAALMAARSMHKLVAEQVALAFVTTHARRDSWRRFGTHVKMFNGAVTRARQLGYDLQEFPLRAAGMKPARFVQMLRARSIHGLLVGPLPDPETELELPLDGFAVVGLGLSVSTPHIERVSNDHLQSVILALRKCREAGYRRIGFVVGRALSERLENRWLAGFHFVQDSLDPRDRVRPLVPERNEEVPASMHAWLEREKPEAVLFGTFTAELAHLVPPELGIVTMAAERRDGRLSGIFQDEERLGAIAVDHLVARLHRSEFGADDRTRLHLLAGVWVPGVTAPGPGRLRGALNPADL